VRAFGAFSSTTQGGSSTSMGFGVPLHPREVHEGRGRASRRDFPASLEVTRRPDERPAPRLIRSEAIILGTMAAPMGAPPTSDAAFPKPPAGYSVRGATLDDVPAVIELLLLADVHDWGSPDFTEDELRFGWRFPELDLGRDVWLVHTDDGSLIGYGWLLPRNGHRQLNGWGVVHPEYRGRGIGAYLMELREHGARLHAALAAPGERVVNHFEMIAPDRGSHELAGRFGYREARHFWQMAIELSGPVPKIPPPDGLRVRTVDPDSDLPGVHRAVTESFAEHWGYVAMAFDDWAKLRVEDPGFDPTLWWLAVDGEGEDERLAGVLLGSIDEGEGYVNTLGVLSAWRGRGVGQALLRRSFAEFKRRSVSTVKLFVDAGNETGATRLYERVGMRVYRQYDTWEKEVERPG
jgi:mycothiol synthase